MNIYIFQINLLTAIILFTVVVILVIKQEGKKSPMIYIIISFALLFIASITNILERMGFPYWDEFEDPIETLFIPLFIFSVLTYCIQSELKLKKTKEQELRENHKRLSVAMETAQEGLWIWDAQKQELVIDRQFSHLKFRPVSYVINSLNYKEIVHPQSQKQFHNLLEALKSGSGDDFYFEFIIRTEDNDYKWVMLNRKSDINTHPEDSEATYGTIVDITHFKNIESELIKSKERAEKDERLKTAFLYNLSHEIRTPVNGIVGFSEILMEEAITDGQRNEYLRLISSSCQKLVSVVDDIIEISKITVGDLNIYHRNININFVIKSLYDAHIDTAQNKGLNLNMILGNITRFVFFTDESKLYRILDNLLNNAIKFTHAGQVLFGYNLYSDKIEFFVEDTGIGISKEYHKEIFENFRQIEVSPFTRKYSGTGLGLSVCKGLAEALGGSLQLNSELGKGTRVNLVLPLNSNAS